MRFSQFAQAIRNYAIGIGLIGAGAFAISAAIAADDMVMDTDGDGLVSLAELQMAYPDITEDVFAALDADASGNLDEAELTLAMEAGVLPAEG